jgi:hypothetical protein
MVRPIHQVGNRAAQERVYVTTVHGRGHTDSTIMVIQVEMRRMADELVHHHLPSSVGAFGHRRDIRHDERLDAQLCQAQVQHLEPDVAATFDVRFGHDPPIKVLEVSPLNLCAQLLKRLFEIRFMPSFLQRASAGMEEDNVITHIKDFAGDPRRMIM